MPFPCWLQCSMVSSFPIHSIQSRRMSQVRAVPLECQTKLFPKFFYRGPPPESSFQSHNGAGKFTVHGGYSTHTLRGRTSPPGTPPSMEDEGFDIPEKVYDYFESVSGTFHTGSVLSLRWEGGSGSKPLISPPAMLPSSSLGVTDGIQPTC